MISLHICKHNSAFKRNKHHETRNRKCGFGVFGVYSKSLSFQLVNYCRPQLEGDFPFMGVARLLAATKKRAQLTLSSFYTLKRVEKKPNLSVELFIPFVAVGLWIQKRAQLTLSSFYTLKKVEKKDQSCD